jgi:hypothetical protein
MAHMHEVFCARVALNLPLHRRRKKSKYNSVLGPMNDNAPLVHQPLEYLWKGSCVKVGEKMLFPLDRKLQRGVIKTGLDSSRNRELE